MQTVIKPSARFPSPFRCTAEFRKYLGITDTYGERILDSRTWNLAWRNKKILRLMKAHDIVAGLMDSRDANVIREKYHIRGTGYKITLDAHNGLPICSVSISPPFFGLFACAPDDWFGTWRDHVCSFLLEKCRLIFGISDSDIIKKARQDLMFGKISGYLPEEIEEINKLMKSQNDVQIEVIIWFERNVGHMIGTIGELGPTWRWKENRKSDSSLWAKIRSRICLDMDSAGLIGALVH